MRILIVHTYGIGDMVMSTPALCHLYRLFPEAVIDLLVFQKFAVAPLTACQKGPNIIEGSFGLVETIKMIFRLRQNRYDYILHTSGATTIKKALFLGALKGKVRIGEDIGIWIPWYKYVIKGNEEVHRVEANLKLISPIAKENDAHGEDSCGPSFCLDASDQSRAETFLKNNAIAGSILVGIHPGSNEKFSHKRWEPEKYIDLIRRIKQRFDMAAILLFSGPDEKKEIAVLKDMHPDLCVVSEDLGLSAALISRLSLMITNDSGLGHIASCFDVKIVTIFSQRSHAVPHRIKPYSKQSCIIDFRRNDNHDEVLSVMEEIENCLRGEYKWSV